MEKNLMEFKVNSKDLEKHLIKIIPAVPTRTPMAILENFLFEIKDGLLTIYATDLEISLKTSLNIVAEDNITAVIPAKLLFDVIRSLPDTTVHFNFTENRKIDLTTENGKYTLSYLLPDEYPDIPSFPGNAERDDINELTLNGTELKEAFDRSSFAMSKEEMRPAMTGTLIEFSENGLRFVATDGHRLVDLLLKNIKTEISDQYIIPEKAISVLSKVLDEKDVKIYLSKTHVSFVLSDMELITRLIGQKYPDYASVVPLENEFILKVNKKDLHDAVKRMMLFSQSSTKKVKFSITESKLDISAEDIDLGAAGNESIVCEYSGDPLEIGFNSAYVNDILSHLNSEKELTFKLHSPSKAVIILPVEEKENQDLMMLVMPVRLNS